MANAFKRSLEITKLTFHVMKEDKELFLFPVLASIFSLLYVIALLFPSFILVLLSGGNEFAFRATEYLVLFGIYFGLAIISTFFSVCTAYTAAYRFEGGDATFKQSLKFGFSRLGNIIGWGLLSATVGLLLRLLSGQKKKGVGGVINQIVVSLAGMAWSIVTVFVIPVMAYHDVGPFEAIKKSYEALKKTWGESLIRHFGLGMVQGALIFVGVLIFLPLLILSTIQFGAPALLLGTILLVMYFTLIWLLFSVANTVFNTAIFAYADTGKVPKGFSEEVVKEAFVKKS